MTTEPKTKADELLVRLWNFTIMEPLKGKENECEQAMCESHEYLIANNLIET